MKTWKCFLHRKKISILPYRRIEKFFFCPHCLSPGCYDGALLHVQNRWNHVVREVLRICKLIRSLYECYEFHRVHREHCVALSSPFSFHFVRNENVVMRNIDGIDILCESDFAFDLQLKFKFLLSSKCNTESARRVHRSALVFEAFRSAKMFSERKVTFQPSFQQKHRQQSSNRDVVFCQPPLPLLFTLPSMSNFDLHLFAGTLISPDTLLK